MIENLEKNISACQKQLLAKSENRILMPDEDKDLIDLLNGSIIKYVRYNRPILSCQVNNCDRTCLVNKSLTRFVELDSSGSCYLDQ